MCGIYGIFDRTQAPVSGELLARMDARIAHRGPDGTGLWHPAHFPGVAMGNRRLAIIDPAGGTQPFVSDDGLVAVVQNGEIFNYVELQAELRAQGVRIDSNSDTEMILRLYERDGIDGLKQLNGMFAVAIHDAREAAVYLVRDRVGEKPLYVWDNGPRVAFASEIKSLLQPELAPPVADVHALGLYLAYNYVPAPHTAFKGVRQLMPGHVLRVDAQGSRSWRYWDLSQQQPADLPQAAWNEELLALLDDATRIRMRADVPFGAFLSGGVDSSTIVGLMSRHSTQPIQTFCIGFEDARFDERQFAQAASERFGTRHTLQVAELDMLSRWPHCIFHTDQPHGDASFMPTLRVSELAAKHVKVVLTGDGGDELFGGYEKYAEFFGRSADEGAGTDQAYLRSTSLFSPEAIAQLLRPDYAAQISPTAAWDLAQPWFTESAHHDAVNRALYLDTQLLLSGNNLVKPDRMGMAVSIENRSPFLDHRVIEFAFRSPGHTKLHQGDLKHWLKRAVAPLIGEELAHRKKQMFTVPVGEWFRNSQRAWLSEQLAHPLAQQLCQPEAVQALLDAHTSGQANNTRELRALAALGMWAQAFGVRLA